MFGLFLTNFIFFAVPLIFLAIFLFALIRYCSARKENKKNEGSVPMKKHLVFLILASLPVAVLLIFVIGIALIMAGAIAFM